MARRPSARHARPTGRGALKAAYADLVRELATERSARHGDQLELIRLAALADGLTAQVSALSTALADARRELRLARLAPPPVVSGPDPYLTLLASQVSDLRALVLAQQQSLAELITRLVDLLDRAWAAPSSDLWPRAGASSVPPPVLPAPEPVVLEPAPPATSAALPPAAQPSTVAPVVDAVEVDDETVLRLRSIRSSLGS